MKNRVNSVFFADAEMQLCSFETMYLKFYTIPPNV